MYREEFKVSSRSFDMAGKKIVRCEKKCKQKNIFERKNVNKKLWAVAKTKESP